MLSKLTEYTIGSTFFAVGDVATVAASAPCEARTRVHSATTAPRR
ncbi:hypothetical protein ACFQX6_28960 [Streptosporangium lutulentum]